MVFKLTGRQFFPETDEQLETLTQDRENPLCLKPRGLFLKQNRSGQSALVQASRDYAGVPAVLTRDKR